MTPKQAAQSLLNKLVEDRLDTIDHDSQLPSDVSPSLWRRNELQRLLGDITPEVKAHKLTYPQALIDTCIEHACPIQEEQIFILKIGDTSPRLYGPTTRREAEALLNNHPHLEYDEQDDVWEGNETRNEMPVYISFKLLPNSPQGDLDLTPLVGEDDLGY